MAIDNTGGTYNGRIYIAWTDFANQQNHIKIAVSVDGGATFPTVLNLSSILSAQNSSVYLEPLLSTDVQGSPSQAFLQDPVPAVAPNGEVFVAWLDSEGQTGSPAQIIVRKVIPSLASPYISLGNSASISISSVAWLKKPKNMANSYRVSSYPTLAVDQNTGYIYVAYTQLNAGDNLNVYFARSTNNGQSFSTPVIATDPAFTSRDQFFPWLSVDPKGCVGLVVCDDRHDPSPTDLTPLVDVYYTESGDNGVSFAIPNIRITSTYSEGTKGAFTTDYQGLASSTGLFFPAWNDFRNNNADVFFSRFNSFSASTLATATAWGSASKTVYTTNNSRWHRIFQNGGLIIYAYSTDDGATWKGQQFINGSVSVSTSSNPALATRNGYLYSVFSTSTSIYFNRNSSGAWLATPFVLTTVSNAEITHLSFAIASDGTGHVVWVESTALLLVPPTYKVRHGTFSTTAPSPVLSGMADVYSSDNTITNPALTLDSNNKPHALWSVSNDIYYKNKISGSWLNLFNVSNNNGVSQYPSILSIGTTIHAIWHDNTPGNNEIYYRVRNGSWGSTQNLSNSSASSTYPFIGGPINSAPVVLWVENVSGNNEIKYTWVGQSSTGLYATTVGSSLYPTFTFRSIAGGGRALGLWTEGSSSPYTIEDNYHDFVQLGKLLAEDNFPEMSPQEFVLHQNYPNPFNPTTTISYRILDDGYVSVKVYDLMGTEVVTLVEGRQKAGEYQVQFDGKELGSGIYLC
jgi:hypothetical protein